jgi:hypothetical protein
LGLELKALIPAIQSQLSSSLLRTLLLDTPDLLSPVHHFLKVLNEKAAKLVTWVWVWVCEILDLMGRCQPLYNSDKQNTDILSNADIDNMLETRMFSFSIVVNYGQRCNKPKRLGVGTVHATLIFLHEEAK